MKRHLWFKEIIELEAFRQPGYDRVPIKYVHKSQLGKIQTDGDYFRTLEELLAGKIDN